MSKEPGHGISYRQPVKLVVAIGLLLVVVISAISNFFTTVNPDLALALNPLNTEARINKLSTRFASNNDQAELKQLKRIAIDGIALDPIDARLYSLLGVVEERQGEPAIAQRLYQHSLQLLPTEIHALRRRFIDNIRTRNFTKAVLQADMILRRWPKRWKSINTLMPVLMQDKDAYEKARDLFSKHRRGKDSLIDSLVSTSASRRVAIRLIKDWRSAGIGNLRPEINRLSSEFIRNMEYFTAYRLFISTLSDTEKNEAGYIFNGNFNLDPNGNLFDWNVPRQSGLVSTIINIPSNTKPNRALELRFNDAPVRFSTILQNMILPASKFTLKLTYSTDNLKTKKPIRLQMKCRNQNKNLGTVSFESGSINKREVEMRFNVPPVDCNIQQLRIYNDNFVQSWKNRYSGSLILHNIAIKLDGA